MRAGRLWLPPALMLLGAVLLNMTVLFATLGDGSYDCPSNAVQLSRHPLPEPSGPVAGFDAARACNRDARDRLHVMPRVLEWSAVAVAGAALLALVVAQPPRRR